MVFKAPDWQDEKAYPSHLEFPSLAFWAWQFLRRNTEYQKDWNLYVQRLQKMAERVPDLSLFVRALTEIGFQESEEGKNVCNNSEKWNDLATLAYEQPEYYEAIPPFERAETVEQWQRRVGGWVASEEYLAGDIRALLRPFGQHLGAKWGLEMIQNPGLEKDDFLHGFLEKGNSTCAYYGRFNDEPKERVYRTTLQKYHVMPILDLRLPVDVLKGQFDALLQERKKMIAAKEFVPYTGRPERSIGLFCKYLRVLDATDAGATVQEIAGKLLPCQDSEGAGKAVRNWLNAAGKIRSETYRLLPVHAAMKRKKK